MKSSNGTDASKPPKAVLFDLDGTLVDSYQAIQQSVNHVRSIHGLSPLSLESVKSCVGNGLAILLEKTCPAGDPQTDGEAFLAHHPSVIVSGTRLLPGVRRTIVALKRRGCHLAVCSNKPLALTRELLKRLKLASFFDAVLGPESVGKPKPAPDMLLKALELTKISKEQAVYVGDMTIDVETARRAGIECWAIPSGTHTRKQLQTSGPNRIMGQFRELLDAVPRQRNSRARSGTPRSSRGRKKTLVDRQGR
ncbi:MAG: HAD-IA family hydrolase [Planctomycetota bacterium]